MLSFSKNNRYRIAVEKWTIDIASLLKNDPSTSHRCENWPSPRSNMQQCLLPILWNFVPSQTIENRLVSPSPILHLSAIDIGIGYCHYIMLWPSSLFSLHTLWALHWLDIAIGYYFFIMLSPNSYLSSRSSCIAAIKSWPSRSLGKATPVHCCHGTTSVRRNPILRAASINYRLFLSLPAAVKRVGVQSARWTNPLQIFSSVVPKWTLHVMLLHVSQITWPPYIYCWDIKPVSPPPASRGFEEGHPPHSSLIQCLLCPSQWPKWNAHRVLF